MKIYLLSFHSLPKGPDLKPGDVHDFADDEGNRLISVGGARLPTEEELKGAEPPRDAKGLRLDGPTVSQWVAAGYKASAYPPSDYASKSTDDEIKAATAAEKLAK